MNETYNSDGLECPYCGQVDTDQCCALGSARVASAKKLAAREGEERVSRYKRVLAQSGFVIYLAGMIVASCVAAPHLIAGWAVLVIVAGLVWLLCFESSSL